MPSRCFLAVTPSPAVMRALVSTRERFLIDAPAWAGEKWVATPLLHVTVAFLGDLDDSVVDDAGRTLTEAASRVPAFDLRLTGVTAVPSARAATMLWAALGDADGRLAALRAALLPAFPQVTVDPRRPMRAHITLVRTRSPRRAPADALAGASAHLEAAGKEPDGLVSVHSVTLFSSTLRPTGPEYREIVVAKLAR